MPYPDFYIIGAMKSGTSTLHHLLAQHPDIEMSRYKEPSFFTKRFDKGTEWYFSRYPGEKKIRGDASPSYSMRHRYPDTAKRIYHANPAAKIIYILRDPVERIVSHLHHDLLRDRFQKNELEKELAENEDYLLTSKYAYQIEPYLQYFPKEQIRVLLFEDLIRFTGQVIADVWSFLQVDDAPLELKAYNVSEQRFKIKYYDWIQEAVRSSRLKKAYRMFWYGVRIKVEKPVLYESIKQNLALEMEEDVLSLARSFDLKLSKWKTTSKYLTPHP